MHKERIMGRRSSLCCVCIVAVLSIGNVFAADKETIAIIGTGDLGDSFGARLAALGYPIVYGSRTPDSEKSQGVVKATGHGATVTTNHDAAQQGESLSWRFPGPRCDRSLPVLVI
jgi:hypothetical protein